MNRLRLALSLFVLVGLAPHALAKEKPPPAGRFASVVITALRYAPPASFKGGVRILILHSGTRPAKARALELKLAFVDAGKTKKVGKIPIKDVESEEYSTPAALRKLLSSGKFNCVVVVSGLARKLSEITKETAKAKALSLACKSSYAKKGISFALVVSGRRLKIYINRAAAKKEGIKFGTALLRRAKLVGE